VVVLELEIPPVPGAGTPPVVPAPGAVVPP